MKKTTFLLSFFAFLFYTQTSSAQNWSTVGTGTNGIINVLDSAMGKLYAGGSFTIAGGIKALNIASWNGTRWDSLKGNINYNVNCMTMYNNKLVVGGGFDSVDGMFISDVATWDGTSWDSLGGNIPVYNSVVNAMVVYNGNLVIGGHFDSINNMPVHNIAMWNGTSWDSLRSGLPSNLYEGVTALAVYNNKLYAAGFFKNPGSTDSVFIARWNGTKWDTLNTNLTRATYISGAFALAVFQNKLYIGGSMMNAPLTDFLVAWNDTVMSSVNLGLTGSVESLYPNNNYLYMVVPLLRFLLANTTILLNGTAQPETH